jgi:hypothetical protein
VNVQAAQNFLAEIAHRAEAGELELQCALDISASPRKSPAKMLTAAMRLCEMLDARAAMRADRSSGFWLLCAIVAALSSMHYGDSESYFFSKPFQLRFAIFALCISAQPCCARSQHSLGRVDGIKSVGRAYKPNLLKYAIFHEKAFDAREPAAWSIGIRTRYQVVHQSEASPDRRKARVLQDHTVLKSSAVTFLRNPRHKPDELSLCGR